MQPLVFDKARDFWQLRYKQSGDAVVGRAKEDHRVQTSRIVGHLKRVIPVGTYYERGLDFGSGWGRMLPYLSELCGHVWAADIVPVALDRLTNQINSNVTPCLLQWPYQIPALTGSFDLLFSCLVLQHITSDEFFNHAACELRRVMKPGSTILLIDNAVDQAHHVKSRTPEVLAQALGLEPSYKAEKITINQRPNDHWLIQGRRCND